MSVVAAAVDDPSTGYKPVPQVALPLISVVTPSFNQGPFIERCIRSVRAQNYPAFEHIIYDNGSTDCTLDILRRYPHLDWVSEPDRGQSDALNKAIRRSRGEIIAWINADDYYEPGAFHVAARELARGTGIMVIQGRIRVVDPDGRVLSTTAPYFEDRDYLVDFWSHGHGLTQPGMLFRRDVLARVGLLDPNLHYAMDYDLWLRVAERYPIKIVDDVLAGFTFHAGSKSGQARFGRGFRQELERVSRRYWGSVLSRPYWRCRRACDRHVAGMLMHEILDAHKHAASFHWGLLLELLHRQPWAVANRHLLAVVYERLAGAAPRTNAAAGAPAAAGGPLAFHRSETGATALQRRVTVVIPTYNRAALVGEAIRSALSQTARQICDIVVVDDGSTDDTASVVQSFDDAVIYLRQPHRGAAAARNAGIRVRPNEFVAFLDSDDRWEPDAVQRQLAAMQQHPELALVTGRAVYRTPDGRTGEPARPNIPLDRPFDSAPYLFEYNFLATPAVMVRTAHLRQTGLFHTGLSRAEDYHLWVRLACRGPAVYLSALLATYARGSAGGLTADNAALKREELRARYLMRCELRRRPDCGGSWYRGLGELLRVLRDQALRAGRYDEAARYGFRSLMTWPWGRSRWEWGRCGLSLLASVTGACGTGL